MSSEFDPKKIINFEKDYYDILNISKQEFPLGSSRSEVLKISEILEKAFRIKARKCHPDFGGSEEQFLDIVRARRILEDPLLRRIFNQGYFDDIEINKENLDFQIDWSKVGTFRKGTPEDTTGFTLFLEICNIKENLNLTPAFFPTTNEHNYEWDFVIDNNKKTKLVVSIVNDENEVLRLSNNNDMEHSLPFKIYVCIPEASLNFRRTENSVLSPDGKTLINGTINGAAYNDFNLLETTNLETAHNYIKNNLKEDLNKFSTGELKTSNKSNAKKLLSSEEMKDFDRQKLSEILNLRNFEFLNIENAGNWIDSIDKKTIKRVQEEKPELPF